LQGPGLLPVPPLLLGRVSQVQPLERGADRAYAVAAGPRIAGLGAGLPARRRVKPRVTRPQPGSVHQPTPPPLVTTPGPLALGPADDSLTVELRPQAPVVEPLAPEPCLSAWIADEPAPHRHPAAESGHEADPPPAVLLLEFPVPTQNNRRIRKIEVSAIGLDKLNEFTARPLDLNGEQGIETVDTLKRCTGSSDFWSFPSRHQAAHGQVDGALPRSAPTDVLGRASCQPRCAAHRVAEGPYSPRPTSAVCTTLLQSGLTDHGARLPSGQPGPAVRSWSAERTLRRAWARLTGFWLARRIRLRVGPSRLDAPWNALHRRSCDARHGTRRPSSRELRPGNRVHAASRSPAPTTRSTRTTGGSR